MVTADLLERCIVAGDIVSNDETVVAAHCNIVIVGRVLDNLDSLALTISALSDDVHIAVESLELAIDEADADVLTVIGESDSVSRALEFEIRNLFAGGHVPDSQHGVTAYSDHLSALRVHGQTPELLVEVRSHAYILLAALYLNDLSATSADEERVLSAHANCGGSRVHGFDRWSLEINSVLLLKSSTLYGPDIDNTVMATRDKLSSVSVHAVDSALVCLGPLRQIAAVPLDDIASVGAGEEGIAYKGLAQNGLSGFPAPAGALLRLDLPVSEGHEAHLLDAGCDDLVGSRVETNA